MKSLPQRQRTKNEATGMRVVGQYVQEFWECGWQPLEQRNDEGIDGVILMKRKSEDLGVRINVQVKCGAGYISSTSEDEIRISIDDSWGLLEHMKYWKQQTEPVVLVFINPSKAIRDEHGNYIKDEKGKIQWVDSRLKAKAWWVDVTSDGVMPDGTKTIITLNKRQVFGEHSKGDFLKLIKPLLGKAGLQTLEPNEQSKKLLISQNLVIDSTKFYQDWKGHGDVFCKALNQKIIISRTGLRHIKMSRRGLERRIMSLKLLGIAKQIIEEVDNFYLLNQEEEDSQLTQKLGLRALVKSKTDGERIVQVIILRKMWKHTKKSKWWFYSVHNRS